jgi:cation-transporting ATPase 13A3/4/5
MAVGIAFAIARLRAQKIYCIAPPRVNLAGRINIMVFDKTGTLTEDGL